MKKWWIWALLLAVVVGFFVFRTKPEEVSTTSEDKIVVVMNNGPKETDKLAVQRLEEDIARFNKVYPEIEIRWTDRPYSPDSFATSMAGGTAEDVISLWATEGYVAERGYALDLTTLIDEWEYKSELNMDVLEPFIRDGKIYALPFDGYIMGLLYNKRLFKEAGIVDGADNPIPPGTWDEFVEVAKKLTAKEKGIAGFGIMGNGAEAGWGFLNWVWQAGGKFEVEEDGKWKAAFAEPGAIQALEFIKKLRWEYDVLQSSLLATSADLGARFAAGQIGMMFSAQDRIDSLVNQYGMKLADIGMGVLPAGPGGYANQMGGNYFVINPNSSPEVQEGAFKWVTWQLLGNMSPERIKERGEDLRGQEQIGTLTALPIFLGEIDEQAREAATEYKDVLVDFRNVWQEAAKHMKPEPPFFAQQLYSEYLGPAVQAVLTKKDANPAKLLSEAARNFQKRFLDQL